MTTTNEVICPHCNKYIVPWNYIETGDMEGEFDMDCEVCGKGFKVTFSTEVRINTEK